MKYVFHFEAEKFEADEPALPLSEVLRIVGRQHPAIGHIFIERKGVRHFLHDGGDTVDLTRAPWLFVDLPAT
jgi:hypothetical protein